MPKGPQGHNCLADAIGNAVHIAKIAIGEIEETTMKQPAKRNSRLASVSTRVDNTTDAQRSEIVCKAANARWK